jgi:hypothetical protein
MKTVKCAFALLLALAPAAASADTCAPGGRSITTGYQTCFDFTQNAGWSLIDPYAANSGQGIVPDSIWVYAPYAANAHSPATLLLFLPGHGADSNDYTDFLKEAMYRGYYVIGLPYQNGKSVQDLCGYWPGCPSYLFQQNVAYPYDNHFYSTLSSSYPTYNNSVNQRLQVVLNYLTTTTFANGFNWNQFYNANTQDVVWSKVVVAGHSEGGATATWIVKNKNVIGGIVFESPYSVDDNDYSGVPTVIENKMDVTTNYTHWARSGGTDDPTATASYLQNDASNWVNRLWMTLSTWDRGYDNTQDLISCTPGSDDKICGPDSVCSILGICEMTVWHGLNMQAAGQALGKHETTTSSCPTIGGNKWWTSTTRPPAGCTGHMSTVGNSCKVAWMPCYWDQVLDAALP